MDYREHYRIDALEFDYWGKDQFSPAETRRNQVIFELCGINPGDRVLDIGSGRGWFSLWAAERGAEVTALDLSEENLKKIKEANINVKTVYGDACDLPDLNGKYDLIVALEVMEHIVETKTAVVNWLKVLKPGGRLLISVPFKEIIRYSLCIHCNQKTPVNSHLHSFDKDGLIKLLSHNGYWVKQTRLFSHKLMASLHLHALLRIFPYRLWKAIDRFCGLFGDRYTYIALIAIPKN